MLVSAGVSLSWCGQPLSFLTQTIPILPQLDSPPTPFHALFTSLSAHPASAPLLSLSLPSADRPADLIPLVGFLLDYPVTYCLSHEGDGRNCLGGEELVVTEAELVGPQGSRCVFLRAF